VFSFCHSHTARFAFHERYHHYSIGERSYKG
jgi:hypothetical protein